MVMIQYHWYRDSFFKVRVSDIYNNVYKNKIIMGKQDEKIKEEEAFLLKKSCKIHPPDVEFIQDCLAFQKTKTLMIKKRGLQADIDTRVNRFVEDTCNN